jgi:lipoprotein-releasing system ATP-binding protein
MAEEPERSQPSNRTPDSSVPQDLRQGPVVKLQDVCKSYLSGNTVRTEVLHHINLTLQRGSFCAVMGPSGSGKSTLLHLVGLLDRPTSGTITICGDETSVMDDESVTRLRGQKIGFVFQYHHLLTAFSALENVMMPMLGAATFPNSAMHVRAAELIDAVGLRPWQHHLANHLSGGQQQRVALARALAMNPALLLADEPTGNLDRRSADAVFELLRRFNREQGTSVLFVTHNATLAERCDELIQVIDGQITT